jgi:hypothetical protein
VFLTSLDTKTYKKPWMFDMFDPFLFSPNESRDHFNTYRSGAMVSAAKDILMTSRQSEEAYLGAMAVLMLNGAV